MTGFADIAVGHVEVVPVMNGLLDDLSAYIADNGFHMNSLVVSKYDGISTLRIEQNQSSWSILIPIYRCVECPAIQRFQMTRFLSRQAGARGG
jgi:hypothetical protein